MSGFEAVVIEETEAGRRVSLRELTRADLMDGDVTVRVSHSGLNYKDGLALTGKAPVVRRYPMVPGIDMAGVVETSDDPRYRPGDAVILNGWGTGETHLGAWAGLSRVKGDWLIPLPEGLTPAEAMAIGTAGYTAMLCLLALERNGLAPSDGPAVVSGAAGGVGSVAVALLSRAGWTVTAVTGRAQEADYLKALGAAEVIAREELSGKPRALGKERWSAGVDCVGSTTLANMLSMIRYGGAVAACGLAGGMDLPAAVAPFILRGVTLIGVDSVMALRARRLEAWERLSRDLDRAALARMTREVSLGEAVGLGEEIVAGRIRGRVVVNVAGR